MGVKLGKMTLRSVFKKPETVLYPFEQRACPDGRKGTIENDIATCILCGICEKRCPTGAIAVDKAQRTWTIDRFRCIQCDSCVLECPKACLTMNPAFPNTAAFKSVVTVEKPDVEAAPAEGAAE